MSALVCGKRTAFDDITSPGTSPPPIQQKRARYRSGGSPSRYFQGTGTQAEAEAGGWPSPSQANHDKLSVLRSLFPTMNSEDLQSALAECGNDLDLTINNLNLLCLAPSSEPGTESERVSPHTAGSRSHGSPDKRAGSGVAAPASAQAPSAAAARAADAAVASAVQQAQAEAEGARTGPSGSVAEHPAAGAVDATLSQVLSVEWVDAVVQEMMSARDLDDARQRAARFLQSFGAAVLEKASAVQVPEAQQLRVQVGALQRDNQILKRAVAIQHERHLAHAAREEEVNGLKQMLGQYQEQLRKLEVNNYALNLHLQKAQVENSMPNRFHPDVF